MIWRIGLLFVGAVLLLGASGAIVTGALRDASTPTANANVTIPVITVTPAVLATSTATTTSSVAPTRVPVTATSATRTVAPASPQATVPRATAATPTLPTVVNGVCAMSLPDGYAADPNQVGYFPARDQTGFVALDSFAGANQSPATLAQAFASGTLSRVLTDYQQTGATDMGDRFRIDYRATSNGRPGRGSTQVQVFGGIGCGVTVFALDSATGPLAATFDLLVRSLMPAQAPRTGTATNP
jgi:hypothetical protein